MMKKNIHWKRYKLTKFEMKAVIIDDDFKIRYILKSVFSRYKDSLQFNDSLQVFSAQDGFEGLGYIFSVRPE